MYALYHDHTSVLEHGKKRDIAPLHAHLQVKAHAPVLVRRKMEAAEFAESERVQFESDRSATSERSEPVGR